LRQSIDDGRACTRGWCRGIGRFAVGAAMLAQLASMPAVAQSLNDLTGLLGKSGGGLGLPMVDQAGPANVAGVLEYCVKNNYLGGGDAASVQQSLLGKLGGTEEAEKDPGYEAGLGGLLDTGGGDTFSLGGAGLQETVTEQVCDLVLEHGQSFL
jgi:hypothetical protein